MKAPATSIIGTTSLLLVLGLLLAALPPSASGFVFPTTNTVKTISSIAPKKKQEEPSPNILQTNDQKVVSSVIAAGFSAALLLATMTLPLPVVAVEGDNGSSSFFAGSYSDPKHPNCKRVIEVVADGKAVLLSGTDGTPGCPADGSGKEWGPLQGRIIDGSSTKILVDFSPKGGPSDIAGQFFFDGKASSAGINWPDGNTWTKK